MFKQSGFVHLLIIIPVVLVIIAGIGFGVYYAQNRTTESVQTVITEPSATETKDSTTPDAINSDTSSAPVLPTATPTSEPTASPTPPIASPTESPSPTPVPVEIKIKPQTEKDKCVLIFETSYKLPGQTADCD